MDPEVQRIRQKIGSNQFPLLVKSVSVSGLRGFSNTKIDFNFPVTAIVGENGTGKTTILKALACAYDNQQTTSKVYYPGKFFMGTRWDEVKNVTLSFNVKHGDNDRQYTFRKPSERWKGTSIRPARNIFFFDISRTQPIDALTGYAQVTKKMVNETESTSLDEEYRDRLSFILGKKYEEARYACPDSDPDKHIGILRQAFGSYSQFHQGAGESSTLDLVNILQNVPNNSLILIDEVEASLHPKAQRRLIKTLLWLCRTKSLQIVMTTHSPYILEELPDEARILILRNSNAEILYGVTPDFCMSSIDDKNHPEITIFVEDREAKTIVIELMKRIDSSLVGQSEILTVGPSNAVEILGQIIAGERLSFPAIAIQDSDQASNVCHKLPGIYAPERQVFYDLKRLNWINLDQRFGVSLAELHAVLDDAMLDPDHHKWPINVGNRIQKSKDIVWDILVTEWTRVCISHAEADAFIQIIKDKLISGVD